jgi:1-acyl-sn-glycerol-3-phosphate acyltransferase
MGRVAGVTVVIMLVTLALLPLQWVAVAWRLPLRCRIPVLYHRLLCALLGVRVRVVGSPHAGAPLLIVSNHVSWLDICVLTSRVPVVFVAKREVGTWPVFGLLARLQRSVFVERERRAKTADVNQEIAARLNEGDPVVLFAEGTSSDGNRVLPFRSGLIGAVHAVLEGPDTNGIAAATVFVQPLSIAYFGINGLPAGRQHRPHVAWYGAMDLLPSLADVIRRGATDVTISWGAPVACGPDTDRKTLTRALEDEVRRLTAAALRQP